MISKYQKQLNESYNRINKYYGGFSDIPFIETSEIYDPRNDDLPIRNDIERIPTNYKPEIYEIKSKISYKMNLAKTAKAIQNVENYEDAMLYGVGNQYEVARKRYERNASKEQYKVLYNRMLDESEKIIKYIGKQSYTLRLRNFSNKSI